MTRSSAPIIALAGVALAAASLAAPLSASAQAPPANAEPVKPTAPQRDDVRRTLRLVENSLAAMRENHANLSDLEADVRVLHRAAGLMDEFDEYSRADDVAILAVLLAECESRRDSVMRGECPWTHATGSVIRGYRSRLDGSVQPYVVEVPAMLDRSKPVRLDVVLHGRNDRMNEARFIHSHRGKRVPEGRTYLTLHVYGRGNNAYRWAGEADVFEAIEAAKRNYEVDDDRVVLRGFSMGGAGAWQLGLHFPSRWCSVEAGAGFTETLRYARLEGKPLPDWRRKALSIYDSLEYARNAFDVPIIGYGGENDPQLQASSNIIDRLKAEGVSFQADGPLTTAEGLDFRRVVGKGMGHGIDPASQSLLDSFHAGHAEKSLDRMPKRIRFVTHTLAYNTARWIAIERMAEHYRRTTVDAELAGQVARIATSNVAVLGVDREAAETVVIDGVEMPLRLAAKGLLPRAYYRKGPGGWEPMDHEASIALMENVDRQKAPGVLGPIDDAFRAPFLVVTPTGMPWNPRTEAWLKARLERFVSHWRLHFRGEVRTKPDNQLTDSDIDGHHLVLFGDPGSNAVLSKILERLPVEWTKERFRLGESYDASTHAPAFIAPNPLNPRRYAVVNSGMTLEPSDFAGTNALLFPRLGDYAVFHVADGRGEVVTSGYFDERWRLPR
jgi:dienelactone hydrolase